MVVLALVASCSGGGEETNLLNDATSQLLAFNLQFDHPSDLEVQAETESLIVLCFASEVNRRHTRCLQFSNDGPTLDGATSERLELTAGGTFHHSTDILETGSGGPEHVMAGYIDIDGDKIYVRATAAQEAGHDDAAWVIPILETVRR